MHAVLVPVYLLLVTPITSSWWAAGSNVLDPNQVCKKSKRLSPKMVAICNKKRELLTQIKQGILLGQRECQYQFRFRRWNCTSSRRSIRKVMLRDTRETGFVNAMLAAGVTYQVTRACTRDELLGCSCNRHLKKHRKKYKDQKLEVPEGDWEWEGCGSENVEYGITKSKIYLDGRYQKKRNDMKTLVTLHNYAAGRFAIKNLMYIDCKCHGLSGSCSLRTCWKKMPHFRDIGNRLRERFDGASKVIPGNDGVSFQPEGETIKRPGKLDLVYSEESDNFCIPNNTLGSFGTQGRICNDTSEAEEGCGILCCGRGYSKRYVNITRSCKCQFKWCCDVLCEICNETTRINACS